MLTAEAGTRELLVDAARAELEQRGVEGTTLRGIARRAGVSHGAPLRHFASLAALLSEVAAEGFDGLSVAMDAAAQAAPIGAGARARLLAAGRAYVTAAVAHPTLFSLMFSPERLSDDSERLASTSVGAFEQLVRLVRAAQDEGWQAESPTRVLAGTLWASVHGLAILWAQGAMAVAGNDDLDQAVRCLFEVLGGASDGTGTSG